MPFVKSQTSFNEEMVATGDFGYQSDFPFLAQMAK
jgi:hypothetical protein